MESQIRYAFMNSDKVDDIHVAESIIKMLGQTIDDGFKALKAQGAIGQHRGIQKVITCLENVSDEQITNDIQV